MKELRHDSDRQLSQLSSRVLEKELTDETTSYFFYIFARFNQKETCNQLKKRLTKLSEVPQNSVQELTALCYLQDYDHSRFHALIKKLLDLDRADKVKSQPEYHIFAS